MFRHFRYVIAVFCLIAPFATTWGAEDPDDGDYQIPEGYEERRYVLRTLIERGPDVRLGEASFAAFKAPTISEKDILNIIRNCVAPETWTKRGSARMEVNGNTLVVLQKKEVQAEIQKVLQWLNESIAPAFRATVIAATLPIETVRKLSAGNINTADLQKALEEAGEANVESVELRGIEGQQVAYEALHRNTYLHDYDVSGSVYVPVIKSINTGLSASAMVYRNPDCATLQIDLSVRQARLLEMNSAKMKLDAISAGKAPTQIKQVKIDDNGKATEGETKTIPGQTKPIDYHTEFTTELPTVIKGGLQTSIIATQGAFTLAGTICFPAAEQTPGKITAVFIRATSGANTVPTLVGVSGLKAGESFRLYPVAAAAHGYPDFSIKMEECNNCDCGVDFATAERNGANPFSGVPSIATNVGLKDSISKSQRMFAEKVRKNKLVEEMGPVVFTRLTEPDHTKFINNLSNESRMYFTPANLNAIALALPAGIYRKLLIEDHLTYEDGEIELLRTNGAQLLADTTLKLLPYNTVNVFAGQQRNLVTALEVSGDSIEPTVKALSQFAFSADFKFNRGSQSNGSELDVRFNAVPSKVFVERVVMESFNVNSGLDVNTLLNTHVDLDKPKYGLINIRTTARVGSGKYTLAGSAPMPATPEGKPDTRQAVLFVRVLDEK